MSIRDWFFTWVTRHTETLARPDWPEPDSHYFRAWQRALENEAVTEDEANAASDRLATNPPTYLDAHLPAVLTAVRSIRATRPAPEAGSREEAWEKSKGCPECGGGGLTRRKLATFKRAEPAWYSLHCTCAMGRWMRSRHESDEQLRGRIFDLATITDGAHAPF